MHAQNNNSRDPSHSRGLGSGRKDESHLSDQTDAAAAQGNSLTPKIDEMFPPTNRDTYEPHPGSTNHPYSNLTAQNLSNNPGSAGRGA